MLYNFEKRRIRTDVDCLTCEYFEKNEKKCNGCGKKCLEYDPKTKTVIDSITRLPLNIE